MGRYFVKLHNMGDSLRQWVVTIKYHVNINGKTETIDLDDHYVQIKPRILMKLTIVIKLLIVNFKKI